MSFILTLILTLVLVLLSGIVGLGLMFRFLTGETQADQAMRPDPFAPPPTPLSVRSLYFFLSWRPGPRQLTYCRDQHGRYRRHRR